MNIRHYFVLLSASCEFFIKTNIFAGKETFGNFLAQKKISYKILCNSL